MKPALRAAGVLIALVVSPAAISPIITAVAQGVPGALLQDHYISTYRLHGMMVMDKATHQPWGMIEDVVVRPGSPPMAVVDVSQMAGHTKMVLVPLNHLQISPHEVMMANANKRMAEHLSPFMYASGSG